MRTPRCSSCETPSSSPTPTPLSPRRSHSQSGSGRPKTRSFASSTGPPPSTPPPKPSSSANAPIAAANATDSSTTSTAPSSYAPASPDSGRSTSCLSFLATTPTASSARPASPTGRPPPCSSTPRANCSYQPDSRAADRLRPSDAPPNPGNSAAVPVPTTEARSRLKYAGPEKAGTPAPLVRPKGAIEGTDPAQTASLAPKQPISNPASACSPCVGRFDSCAAPLTNRLQTTGLRRACGLPWRRRSAGPAPPIAIAAPSRSGGAAQRSALLPPTTSGMDGAWRWRPIPQPVPAALLVAAKQPVRRCATDTTHHRRRRRRHPRKHQRNDPTPRLPRMPQPGRWPTLYHLGPPSSCGPEHPQGSSEARTTSAVSQAHQVQTSRPPARSCAPRPGSGHR